MIGWQAISDEDKKYYYDTYDRDGVTILDSIDRDKLFLQKELQNGKFHLNRVVLGGCATPKSVIALETALIQINGNKPMNLIVVDIEPIAIKRLENLPPPPKNIQRQLILADLLSLPPDIQNINLIRLDYLQNYIAPQKQIKLLRQFKTILAPFGIVISTLTSVHNRNQGKPRGENLMNQWKGCRKYWNEITDITTVDLSNSFINDICVQVGFAPEIVLKDVVYDYEDCLILDQYGHEDYIRDITVVDDQYVIYRQTN